jgi:hypothetical protein
MYIYAAKYHLEVGLQLYRTLLEIIKPLLSYQSVPGCIGVINIVSGNLRSEY